MNDLNRTLPKQLLPADLDKILEKYGHLFKVYKSLSDGWRFQVNSEPHHHHHVPGNRRKRKDNFEIHTLDAAFAFVARYIESGEEYKP